MIAFPAHLALTLPDNPTLAESLQYQLTGFLVVAFTLGALAFLVSLIGRLFASLDARRAKVSAALPGPVPARIPEPSPSAEEISPAVLAAIAGAVAALGDSRFAIRGVQVADPRQNLAWSAEGRRSIYASRNVR
jgi:hypothetical protein